MFIFKKAVVVLGALATLAIPAVASADDYGRRDARRDEHAAVVQHQRVERGERDRGARDRFDHRRWEGRDRFRHDHRCR